MCYIEVACVTIKGMIGYVMRGRVMRECVFDRMCNDRMYERMCDV